MKKQNIFLIIASSVLTLVIIVDIILEFLGVSTFLFGKKMIEFVGLFIILSSLGYIVFTYSVLNSKKDSFNKKIIITTKVVITILGVFLIIIGFILCLFLSEKTVYKNISDDERHEVFIQTDSFYGGWNVTIYKRYTPFFKVENKSFYIDNMSSENSEIDVAWYEDSCDITYDYYSDFVETSEQGDKFTQTIYFNSPKQDK